MLKIVSCLLIITVIIAIGSIVASAFVWYTDTDYANGNFSPMPFDCYWYRSDTGNYYYYDAIQNYIGYDYVVDFDAHFDYYIVKDSIDRTPLGVYNPLNTERVLYQRLFRYLPVTTAFGMYIRVLGGKYDTVEWLRLAPIPIVVAPIDAKPTITCSFYVGYIDSEELYDEARLNIELSPTGRYHYVDDLYIHSFDYYDVLTGVFNGTNGNIYIYDYTYYIPPNYNGCGYVTYMADASYRNPYEKIVAPYLFENDFGYYIGQFMTSFGRLFAVEFIPGINILTIMGLALVIPTGFALIRRI